MHRYDFGEDKPDAALDRLTRIAARAFCAPISTISLGGPQGQCFVSRYGIDLRSTHSEYAFCAHALSSDDLFVVCDACQDPRFAANPIVTGVPGIRFYLGAPLKTHDGYRIGAICVLDTKPHLEPPEADLCDLLKDLADEAMELLERHREKRELELLRDRLLAEAERTRQVREEANTWQQRAIHALEAGQMGYWERDSRTDKVSFSPLLEDVLGLNHKTFDGSMEQFLQNVHPDDRSTLLNAIAESMHSNKNYRAKYRVSKPDGSERWITSTGTYQKDAEGRFAGAYGVSWDCTASELAASKLRMSEQLFRVLSETAAIGIFQTDDRANIVYANPKLSAINGVPEKALLGHGWLQFIHPEDRDRLKAEISDATRKLVTAEFEHRILSPDGTVRWVHVQSVPLTDQHGKLVSKVGTLNDVTQMRQMVDDLKRAKDAAEVANRAKDLFLANVSHELRTPLNGVLGMSDLLLDTGLNAEQLEMAEIMRQSARGLLSVVNDMLDLSRIEAGHLSIDYEPFDLRRTVFQTVSLFRADAHRKGVSVAIHYSPELRDCYIGDAARIRQILTNYLSNAMKFTLQGDIGIEVTGENKGSLIEVRLAVHDGGSGIDPTDQKRLFQPFSQVDSSSTRSNGGAGLGLAICKRLAELMGGAVGVESSPGEGSTFWVRVQLQPATAGLEPVAPRHHATAEGDARVLVVEDNPINQKVAVGALSRLGWPTDVAENGEAAIALCKAKQYAIVLMDCQMPEMDGYAATRWIRVWENSEGRPNVPIVALTAHAMAGEKERCLEAGMNDHLAKPIGLEELRDTLDRWAVAPTSGATK